jgi:putative DNA primase/helicase
MPDIDGTLRGEKNTLLSLLDKAEEKGDLNEEDEEKLGTDQPDPDVLPQLEQYRDKQGNLTGVPKQSRNNLYKILNIDRRYKRRIWENLFDGSLYIGDHEYKDTDDTKISLWVDMVYGIKFADTTVAGIAKLIGEENGINPLQDWLNSVKWDGTRRTDDWLIRATGCEDTELNRMMGNKWLIQAIARAMRPGCKADCVLILIGSQGAKKSSLLRTIATEQFFSDTPLDIGSANAYTQIQRAWIYEVAELDSVRRSANSATKAFISAQEDNYRPAYGRRAVTIKRHTVFAGTTNDSQFMNDWTGSRRYWPVRVKKIDLDWVSEFRDQLWAEAILEFNSGATWWLEQDWEEEREEESQMYRQEDPWRDVIVQYVQSFFGTVSTRTLMEEALKLEKNQMSRHAEIRVAEILRELGFKRGRKRIGEHRSYVWSKPKVIELNKIGDTNE